jgi:hypothetical protein
MSKFRINNATESAAIHKMEVASAIMRKCGITYQDWADILFETGCRFVEMNITHPHIRICLLQNQQLGFWDWWLVLSLEDDESVLTYPEVASRASYIREKERLLNLREPVKKFDYFLIQNGKLNELEKI